LFRAFERGLLCQQQQSNQNAAKHLRFLEFLARYALDLVDIAYHTITGEVMYRFKYDPMCFLASLPLALPLCSKR